MSSSHSTRPPKFPWRTCASSVAILSTRGSTPSLWWPTFTKSRDRAPASCFWPAWRVSPLPCVISCNVISEFRFFFKGAYLVTLYLFIYFQRFLKEESSLGPISCAMWKQYSGMILSTQTANPTWSSQCPATIHAVSGFIPHQFSLYIIVYHSSYIHYISL